MKVTGERQVMRALQEFKGAVQRKMLRKGVRAYNSVMAKGLKGNPTVPKRTGALRRSFSSVVRTRKGVVSGHVGARKGLKMTVAATARGGYTTSGKGVSSALQAGRKVMLDVTPSRYLHLADKKWGFMAQTERSLRHVARGEFIKKLQADIPAEAARIRAKSAVK